MISKGLKFENSRYQAGFTLIELLIAMLISLILIFASTTLYSSLKSSTQTAQNLANAQESLRGAFYLLSRSVRQADTFTLNGASGAAATELTTTYGEIPAGNTIYSCLGNTRSLGDQDVFSSDGTDLYCDDTADGSGAELIALDVSKIEFLNVTGNNDDGLTVNMIITGMPDSYSTGFSFTLALRQKILKDLAE